jgi:hypothetical protein
VLLRALSARREVPEASIITCLRMPECLDLCSSDVTGVCVSAFKMGLLAKSCRC